MLDFKEAYPLTKQWVLKESIVLAELQREIGLQLRTSMHLQHAAASAQLIEMVPGGKSYDQVYQHHFNSALLQYSKIGRLLCPWDDEWSELIDSTAERLGDTYMGKTPTEVAKLIQQYEALKRAWFAEQEKKKEEKNERSGHAASPAADNSEDG
jgi:hypothetical protein